MKTDPPTRMALNVPLDEVLGSKGNIRVLRVLATTAAGPMNAAELAAQAGLTRAGAGRVLERLSKAGIVLRVGGGRSQQYMLSPNDPLSDELTSLFTCETARFQALKKSLRSAFSGVHEVRAAWMLLEQDRLGDSLQTFAVVEPKGISETRGELRTRLADVERDFDQIIELSMLTEADEPSPGRDSVALLAGVLPQQLKGRETPAQDHAAMDERALNMSRGLARLLRHNPSLRKRAMTHLNRLAHEGPGTATADVLEWRQVLETYSPNRLEDFLTSTSSRADRLRQSSPFFAVLSADERDALLTYMEQTR